MQPVMFLSLFLAVVSARPAPVLAPEPAPAPAYYRINQSHGREVATGASRNNNHGRGYHVHQNHGRDVFTEEQEKGEHSHASFLTIINHYLAVGGAVGGVEGVVDSVSRLVGSPLTRTAPVDGEA